jgi:hypothetical protein
MGSVAARARLGDGAEYWSASVGKPALLPAVIVPDDRNIQARGQSHDEGK